MPCGGCGGGNIIVAPTRKGAVIPTKQTALQVQRALRPKSLKKVTRPVATQAAGRAPKKVRPRLTAKARKLANNVRVCPVCTTALSIEITGPSRRKRFRCQKCRKIFA